MSLCIFFTYKYLTVKFIYFEKATKFCEISTVDLTVTTQDKSKVVKSQKFCVLLTKPQLYKKNPTVTLYNKSWLICNLKLILFGCVMANNKINCCLGNIEINIWIRYKIRYKIHRNQTRRTQNTQDTRSRWGPSDSEEQITTLAFGRSQIISTFGFLFWFYHFREIKTKLNNKLYISNEIHIVRGPWGQNRLRILLNETKSTGSNWWSGVSMRSTRSTLR